MKRFLSLALIGLLVPQLTFAQSGGAANSRVTETERNSAQTITAATLKDYLYFIASDDMEGRDTPSRGLNLTAKYIGTNLSHWGFKPAGDDGTFFQKIKVTNSKIDPKGCVVEIDGQKLTYGEDFLADPIAGNVSAPLVFVGHGWYFKAKNINPYKNVDIKDKIVVTYNSDPPKGVDFSDFQGKRGEDWYDPTGYAESHGAKAVISIPSFRDLAQWARSRDFYEEKGFTVFDKLPNRHATIPVITLSAKSLATLFRKESSEGATIFTDGDSNSNNIAAFDFNVNKKVTINITPKAEASTTQNIVAIWEGSDPKLKNEYVAMGAHYDHVGIGNPVNGDNIYNGADDDGSGTTALLTMAEALATNKVHAKRSLLFVWHCGEEKGLLGSKYFVDNPTIPLNNVVTQLNIDMIGRSKPEGDTNPADKELSSANEVYVIGSKMLSTELGELSEQVNSSYLNLKFNYTYDNPNDPNRFFYRSDHYNYAQKGIPIIFYFDGVHADYHRPSDSPDKIDYVKMEKITRTIYLTAWELANRESRPKIDKTLTAQSDDE